VLNNEVVDDLVEAILSHRSDPRKSLNDTGRALEDFLRLNFASDLDLSNCNGIGQISNELQRHALSTSKHNAIVLALGQIRSMGDAHGADKVHGTRWVITDKTALSYVLMVVGIISSLMEFKKHNVLIF
jgi:hypothetical protein